MRNKYFGTFITIWCLVFPTDVFGGWPSIPEMPKELPKVEAPDLSNLPTPKMPPMDSDFRESDSCHAKTDNTFEALAGHIKRSEPCLLPATPPCETCLIGMLSSIKIVKDAKPGEKVPVVKIASQKDGDKPESMYYTIPMTFTALQANCSKCTIKTFMGDVTGSYIGTWKDPLIEVRVYKPVWDGDVVVVLSSFVQSKLVPDMIEMECKGDDGPYKKACELAHLGGIFATIFYQAATVLFTVKSNEEFAKDALAAQTSGLSAGGSSTMGRMMSCNDDD